MAACECNKSDAKQDASQVVGDPPDRAFSALLWSRSNIGMFKSSPRHGSKPASDQAEVGWRHLKGMFEEQHPEIECEGCTKPDEDCATEGEDQMIQGLLTG